MPAVRVLSCHAAYRCQHAGACCTSNWPIPVEADRLAGLRAAMASRRLRPATSDPGGGLDMPAQAPVETPALLARVEGRCVFYDDAPAASRGRCRIHTALGHDALPLACRQFPRVSVHDPRGVSVTLSHYCPTAAGLLDAEHAMALDIAIDAPAFPPEGDYVGLDARDALPPLLRRDMLMDWDAWWACERLAVGLFDEEADPSLVMARLSLAVADLQAWSPPDGPLGDRVRAAFAQARSAAPGRTVVRSSHLIDAVFESIPADVRPARLPDLGRPSPRATRRFLAAHAFANWTIHLGDGLGAWLRSIEAAAALIRSGAGLRQADLLLRHLVDPGAFARALPRI